METIKMTKLTELLNQTEPKLNARFCMSGGNCGTIYLGKNDLEGYAEFAVGPSNYSTNEAYFGELCWGVDGSEKATYFNGTQNEFNEENLAQMIITDYLKMKGIN